MTIETKDVVAELIGLLRRDAVGLRAWSEGKGPYPETIKGVAKMKAERADAAADLIQSLSERIAVLQAQQLSTLAAMYNFAPKAVAAMCDNQFDRSGALLGEVRKLIARASLTKAD